MKNRDKFRGCLLGGAAGDALGYAVEFASVGYIFQEYGPRGITEYRLSNGLARVSDDTQMTLFTANGLLNAATQRQATVDSIHRAYLDWYHTQWSSGNPGDKYNCWLMNVPELHASRAPGNTCMSSLASGTAGSPERPLNRSKGCGGVMRVAPVGLFLGEDASAAEVQRLGAQAAALTHGHELGWLSAAAAAHIVHLLAYELVDSVEVAAREAMRAMPLTFPRAAHAADMVRLMERALELARGDMPYLECFVELGAGWVGDEALAVALYCAAKYETDFDSALIAAVNHSGDSDSTGAICGNILGAKLGLAGIPKKYLTKLEMRDVIQTVADDLFDCPDQSKADPLDKTWAAKYIDASYAPPSGS